MASRRAKVVIVSLLCMNLFSLWNILVSTKDGLEPSKLEQQEKLEQLERQNRQLKAENQLLIHRLSNGLKVQELKFNPESKDEGNALESGRNKQLEAENKRLRGIIQELKLNSDRTTTINPTAASTSNQRTLTWNLLRPQNDDTVRTTNHFTDSVTVLLYQDSTIPHLECVQAKKMSLQEMFPDLKVFTQDKAQLTIGSAFNSLFFHVKTKYFLFLDSSTELAEPSSDHSVTWLLHALTNVPELDFISGSLLKPDSRLEIPCYRLLLCNWTLSQRYEYRRSVGELMICENIASSFMGRTSRIRQLFGENNPAFDANLPVMSTTDFFLRAKQKGAVAGVLPEVIFTQSKRCHTTHASDDRKKRFQALLPFAEKHKVFRFKDADSNVFELCTNDSPIAGEGICSEDVAHKVMLSGGHWAFKGTFAYPYMIDNLQQGMVTVVEFLESQNLTYYIAGGVPLGALKFGGILPWDAGDVDFFVYIENSKKLYDLMKNFALGRGYTVKMHEESDQVQVFCTPANVGTKMGGLMSLITVKEPVPDATQFVKMKANGKWISCNKSVFREFRKYYGINYLQHRMYNSAKVAHCLLEGHNACLPNFQALGKLQGTAGTFREYFCDL